MTYYLLVGLLGWVVWSEVRHLLAERRWAQERRELLSRWQARSLGEYAMAHPTAPRQPTTSVANAEEDSQENLSEAERIDLETVTEMHNKEIELALAAAHAGRTKYLDSGEDERRNTDYGNTRSL